MGNTQVQIIRISIMKSLFSVVVLLYAHHIRFTCATSVSDELKTAIVDILDKVANQDVKINQTMTDFNNLKIENMRHKKEIVELQKNKQQHGEQIETLKTKSEEKEKEIESLKRETIYYQEEIMQLKAVAGECREPLCDKFEKQAQDMTLLSDIVKSL